MSDRRLRERALALTQRFQANERRVRALQLRAFPGAVRTGSADIYTPIAPSAWTPAVQATVTAGRWEIIGHGAFSMGVSTESEILGIAFGVTDPSSGLDVGGEMTVFDAPANYGTIAARSDHTGWVTLMSTCDLVNPLNQVTVSLLVVSATFDTSGTSFTVTRPRLRLMPV